MALGIAFRNKPVERITVDVQKGHDTLTTERADAAVAALKKHELINVHVEDAADCQLRLRTGKTDLVVVPRNTAKQTTNTSSTRRGRRALLARSRVDDALQLAAGTQGPAANRGREEDRAGRPLHRLPGARACSA